MQFKHLLNKRLSPLVKVEYLTSKQWTIGQFVLFSKKETITQFQQRRSLCRYIKRVHPDIGKVYNDAGFGKGE